MYDGFPDNKNKQRNSLTHYQKKIKQKQQKRHNKNMCPGSWWNPEVSMTRTEWRSLITVLFTCSEKPQLFRLRGSGQRLLQEAVQRQTGWNLGWRPGDLFPFCFHQWSNLCQRRLGAMMVKEPFYFFFPLSTIMALSQIRQRIIG